VPPSFGILPVFNVEDYLDKVPEKWKKQKGVFIPLFQREALWIEFGCNDKSYPFAMKVASKILTFLIFIFLNYLSW
jgi:hypothetical protein